MLFTICRCTIQDFHGLCIQIYCTIILYNVVVFFTCLTIIRFVTDALCRFMPVFFVFPNCFSQLTQDILSRYQFCNLGNGHYERSSVYNPCIYSWYISLNVHSRYLHCHCQFFYVINSH